MLLVEEEGVLAVEQRTTDAVAERIAHAIAHHGGEEAADGEQAYVEDAQRRGEEPCRKQEAVAREEEADQQARLSEHDSQDADIAGRLNEGSEVQLANCVPNRLQVH